MVGRITLYSTKYSPLPHRVQMALEEARADYKLLYVDFMSGRPEWYTSQINPAGQVPAIAYGGPDVPPEQPSPESIKLTESSVLLEFVADLFPSARLLPTDPVQRARARLFVNLADSKLTPAVMAALSKPGSSPEEYYSAIEAIQNLLPENGKYALGDAFTIADIAIAPFFPRMEVVLANDLGKYPVGEAIKVYNTLRNDPKYAKYRRYADALKERESFKNTFDEKDEEAVIKARCVRKE